MSALIPRPAWVLAGAGLLLTLITGLWISLDNGIAPPTDSAHHLLTSLLFARGLEAGGLSGLWETMRHFYVGWPPASYLLLYGPLGWLIGDHSQLIRMFGVVLLPLLLWGTYRVSRQAGASRQLATLAAVLCIFSFGVSGQLRQVSIDLPATGATLLAMVLLGRPGPFASPGKAALVGAACGLCLFTRVQAVFFLVGPLMVHAALALIDASTWRRRGERALAVGLGAVAAMLASSPWWFGRLRGLWKISTAHLDPGRITPRGDPDFWSGLWYYLGALGKLCGWPLLAVALITTSLLLRKLGVGRELWRAPVVRLLLPWILGGILGCAAGVHREPRYLLPAVPAMAALAVLGLGALRPRARQLAGAALLLAVALPTLLVTAFPIRNGSPLVNHGLVEWAYTRETVNVAAEAAGARAAAAMQEASEGDLTGAGSYLLIQQHPTDQFMARMAVFTAPHMPRLLFSPLVNQQLINSPLHLRERKRRRVFVMAEGDFLLDLPFLWEIKKGASGNRAPVRLYLARPGHPLQGQIWTRSLPRRK